jgi:hypothetical protein
MCGMLIAFSAMAQSASTLMGARSMGMAYASSCLHDEWAMLNNPAGLSVLKNVTSAFSYNAYPSFKTFNRMTATLSVPVKVGVAGVSVFRFGDNLYNEQIVSAGFANKFGLASLGLQVNYIQYEAQGFGNTGVVTVNMGGIATLTPQLMIGAHVTNVNQPKITSTDDREYVPTILSAGIAVKPSEKLLLCSEIEKDLRRKTKFKGGVEYTPFKKFSIRTGVDLNPDAGFIGFGIRPRRLVIDYALEYNLLIGINHQATVSYKFTNK